MSEVKATDIDWSRQEVPAGATHFQPEGASIGGNLARYFKDDFKSVCAPQVVGGGWRLVESLEIDLTGVIEIPKTPAIDWDNAPDGAEYYSEKYRQYYKRANHGVMLWDADKWVRLIGFAASDFDKLDAVKRLTPTATPAPKRLTQAVFEGLPSEYRWAAVESDGRAYAHVRDPRDTMSGAWRRYRNYACFLIGNDYDASDWKNSKIERPESITDVARSIEAARVEERSGNRCANCTFSICGVIGDCIIKSLAELDSSQDLKLSVQVLDDQPEAQVIDPPILGNQSGRKHSHYFKDVSGIDQIDVYAVLRLFEVTDPCLQHIVKKALCAGKRGAKDWAKDVQEIADTAQRLIELEQGK